MRVEQGANVNKEIVAFHFMTFYFIWKKNCLILYDVLLSEKTSKDAVDDETFQFVFKQTCKISSFFSCGIIGNQTHFSLIK